jgi:hypothetical protein
MQHPLQLSVAALLAAAVNAQVNPFVIYPQDPERQAVTCTSFVGRPDWNRAAEALVEFDQAHFRSLGDSNGFQRLFGVYHWVADERLATVENYSLVVRAHNPTGNGPDMSSAGELLRVPGLSTPPSANQARGTWIMNDGFSLQGGFIPPGDYFLGTMPPRIYIGVGLPANGLWPTSDGHALFRADLLHANTGATVGENHRAGAPNLTYAGLTASNFAFSTPWNYILGPMVTSPNLHIGGVDPTSTRMGLPTPGGTNLGMGGLYPDIGGQPRRDGITLRITDNLAPFGICVHAASLGFQAPYFESSLLGTLIGYAHVASPNASQNIVLGVATLQTGVREQPIALPGQIPTALVGSMLVFQTIVWDANVNLAQWTNAQAVRF